MKYAVDRIEGDIVILQDLETKEIIEIEKELIKEDINDGDILIYENDTYKKDENTKEERLKKIQEKLDRLKELH